MTAEDAWRQHAEESKALTGQPPRERKASFLAGYRAATRTGGHPSMTIVVHADDTVAERVFDAALTAAGTATDATVHAITPLLETS